MSRKQLPSVISPKYVLIMLLHAGDINKNGEWIHSYTALFYTPGALKHVTFTQALPSMRLSAY